MAIALILILYQIPVLANGGPGEPSVYNGDGCLHFDEDSDIRLVSESIQITIDDKDDQNIIVEVNYRLIASNGNEASIMYFVLPKVGEYSSDMKPYDVWINDHKVTDETLLMELPEFDNWKPKTDVKLIDPISGEVLDKSYTVNSYDIFGIKIPLEFDSGETKTLKIVYQGRSGVENYDVRNPVMNYIYYMTPADFWLKEPVVSYSIVFPPQSNYELYSSLPLEKRDNVYKGNLSDIPYAEWQIAYVDSTGLIFNINNLAVNNRIIYSVVVAIIILTIYLRVRFKKSLITIAGYAVVALLLVLGTGSRGYTYSLGILNFLKVVLYFVIIPGIYFVFKLGQWIIRQIGR